LAAGALTGYAAGTAVGTAAQVIYDANTGFLWFDRDGTATTFAAQHFAALDTKPTILGANEFTVI
jgi:Ca2+-binding RTX toxin-like protein